MIVRKRKRTRLQFKRMQVVILIFAVLVLMLIAVQKNVTYQKQERRLAMVSAEQFQAVEDGEEPFAADPACMLVWEEGDKAGESGRAMMEAVLGQMKIPYELCEAGQFQPDRLGRYETVVLAATHYGLLQEGILELMDWVGKGGGLMIAYPPETDGSFALIQERLGIHYVGDRRALVEALYFAEDYMLGSGGRKFPVTDPYESSLAVALDAGCRVYLESAEEYPVPIVWTYRNGSGTVVVNNLGFLDKGYRGFYSAAYSLLGEACVYPVINAATFYIDDFPSPVPAGESSYIRKDYGMDIGTFYTREWWKDVYHLAEQYGIRYTGLVIEEYSDQVELPCERNPDLTRYQYFGNMLLDQGGEIGFHGYNHMPLCLENFDYLDLYDSYRQWKSYEDMKGGLQELQDFCTMLFPREEFCVYVPPSNILSDEGRAMIAEDFPQIRAIASVYLPGGLAYEQEFEVAQDGVVETPRTISGYIMDDYSGLVALSELNFHFVSSHFQHPDDVLDEDRGAALGWKEMFARLSGYVEWLYRSAPEIRTLTGSEMAGAVQRYDRLEVERILTKDRLTIRLHGFVDEAWLFVRLNGKAPKETAGGSLTELADGLYLLKAESSRVEIGLE